MNAIIVHGIPSKDEYFSDHYPSASNSHWIPWLQKQLLMRDVRTDTPEMFKAYKPDYQEWKTEFEKNAITPETILVGHSCGGGFLLRWLSENKKAIVNKVILVAPWLDPDKRKGNGFFDFTIDPNLGARAGQIIVFESTNDEKDIYASLKMIKRSIKNITVRTFENYGHFCYEDLGTDAFPELLEAVLD
ncbi:MAG TPA: alpha/beta hydrolase [bacterium]|nr:alpha/beta hydrolase [bacterium]